MLRKELKAGDLFSYEDAKDVKFYVEPKSIYAPKGIYDGAFSSDKSRWLSKVELIWSPWYSKEPEESVTKLPHYADGKIEAADVIDDWGLDWMLANVVKYIKRHGKKPGADAKEDLKKARAYLSRKIAALEGRRAWE